MSAHPQRLTVAAPFLVRPGGSRALIWLLGVSVCGVSACRSQAPAPQNPAADAKADLPAMAVREQGISPAAAPREPQPGPDAVAADEEKQVPKNPKLAKGPSDSPDRQPAKAQPKKVKPESKPAPGEVQKVLLLGDSLAATGFGVILEKALDAHPQIDCARRAKSATGLARPDFFDWFTQSRRAVAKHKPDLVIVILGGNDGQDLVMGAKHKGRARWKKGDDWDKAYAKVVQEFVDGMSAPGRKLLWLGLPQTDTKSFEKKLVRIRAAQQEGLNTRSSWVSYIDTTPMVVDAKGKVKKKVRRGKRVAALRQSDGIHFTMHGSHYFAEQVYPVVVNALGLDPVQAK